MKKIKVSINGFGRIGRAFFKLAITRPELEIVAINDLGDLKNLAYLLKYDSIYGRFDKEVNTEGSDLVVNGQKYKFLQEKDASKLPWGTLDVDIVVESSGVFESYEKARVHKRAGAKHVVITAPAKDNDTDDAKTVLMGINEDALKTCSMSSTGSCTTNSASPLIEILSEKIGIKKAFLNTAHAYTSTQSLTDSPSKNNDYRRARAAAVNISPSTTGAAIAVTRAIPKLKGKFDGTAIRVPVVTTSLSAITFLSERPTSVEEINSILTTEAATPRWKNILKVTNDQLVSTDVVGESYAAIADLSLTKVVDGDLCAVYSWYDNEFGYTNTLVDHVIKTGNTIKS